MKKILTLLLIISAFSTRSFAFFQETLPAEKVHVHTNQPYYLSGETLKYKAYLVAYQSFAPSTTSKVVHVSLWNEKLELIQEQRIIMKNGMGHGEFKLSEELPSGNYLLASHTTWMKNFPGARYSKKLIRVLNPDSPPNLAPETELTARFYPEGGLLIGNYINRVAFAFNETETPVSGWIVNTQEDTLATFSTTELGYGKVDMFVASGSAYTALVNHKGQSYRFPIGQASTESAALHLMDPSSDSLSFVVNIGDQYSGDKIKLLVQNKGNILLGAEQRITNRGMTFLVPRSLLGSGLNQATIVNENNEALSRRLVYKRASPAIQANIPRERRVLQPRSEVKIPVNLTTKDNDRQRLSVSVTVKKADYFSRQSEGIGQGIDLFSEIGFTSSGPGFTQALTKDAFMDNFLITQELAAFSVGAKQETENDGRSYGIEDRRRILISGKVYEAGSKQPIADSTLYCSILGTTRQFYTVKTDNEGRFTLAAFAFNGAADLIVKLAGANDNADNIVYELEGQLPAVKAADFNGAQQLDASAVQNYLKFTEDEQLINRLYYPSTQAEPEFVVRSNRLFSNYNVEVDYTEYIELDDFREVVKELVPGVVFDRKGNGFRFKYYDRTNDWFMDPHENQPLMLIDGLPVFDAQRLMSLPQEKIKNVYAINNKYVDRESTFDGIFELTTVDGDYYKTNPANHGTFHLEGYHQSRIKDYNGLVAQEVLSQKQLPDFRPVLYWNPELEVFSNSTLNLEFMTADDVGDYLLEIQGIDEAGNTLHYETILTIRRPEE